MIRQEHPFDIMPDLRKAASTKAASVIRPNQLIRKKKVVRLIRLMHTRLFAG
jgi:hypothetical protein